MLKQCITIDRDFRNFKKKYPTVLKRCQLIYENFLILAIHKKFAAAGYGKIALRAYLRTIRATTGPLYLAFIKGDYIFFEIQDEKQAGQRRNGGKEKKVRPSDI